MQHISEAGAAASKASGTTVSANPSYEIPAGKIVLVRCVSDNAGTTDGDSTEHSVTDTQGHTWTRLKERRRSSLSAKAGVVVSLWAAKLTAALTTSDSITLTLANSGYARAVSFAEYDIDAGKTFQLDGAGAGTGSSTLPTATISGLSSATRLWIGAVGVEGPDTDSFTEDNSPPVYTNRVGSSGGWGTTGGSAASNVAGRCGDRSGTETGDTYAPSFSTSRDWACVLVALQDVAAVSPISGTFAATASFSASLRGIRRASGSFGAAASLSGSAIGRGALSATLASAAAFSAVLRAMRRGSGSFGAAAAFLGSVIGRGSVSGAFGETTAFSASLRGIRRGSGSFGAAASFSGSAIGRGSVSGAFGETTAFSASLRGIRRVSGSFGAASAFSGNAIGRGSVSGAFSETATFTGAVKGRGQLSGDFAVLAEFTGNLTEAGGGGDPISGAFAALASFSGALGGSAHLSANFVASADFSASLRGIGSGAPLARHFATRTVQARSSDVRSLSRIHQASRACSADDVWVRGARRMS